MDQQEENYLIGLKQARRIRRKKTIPRPVLEKMKEAIRIKESGWWPLVFMIGAFNDLMDLMIIGSVPILGDVLDLATSAILIPFMFSLGGQLRIKFTILATIISGLEFIPFPLIEMLSLWTVVLLWAYHRARQRAELAQRALEKYKRGRIDRKALHEFS